MDSEAYFGSGTKLVVLEHEPKPPKVILLQPASKEIADKKTATLVCVISNFYPDNIQIQWRLNGVNIRADDARIHTDAQAISKDGTKFSISSRLRLEAGEWMRSKYVMCHVDHYQKGDQPTSYNSTIMVEDVPCEISNEKKLESIGTGWLTYLILICKSFLYGIIVLAFVLKSKKSHSKRFD